MKLKLIQTNSTNNKIPTSMVVHACAADHNAIYLMRLQWIIIIIQNIKLIIIYYWIVSHQQSYRTRKYEQCLDALSSAKKKRRKRRDRNEGWRIEENIWILTEIFECSKFQFDAFNFLAFILLLPLFVSFSSSTILHPLFDNENFFHTSKLMCLKRNARHMVHNLLLL